MAKLKQLLDLYRFPGFVPRATIRGIFGQPRTVVITLLRRRKKRFAASAVLPLRLTTTNGPAAPGISRVATSMSISPMLCGAFAARGVAA